MKECSVYTQITNSGVTSTLKELHEHSPDERKICKLQVLRQIIIFLLKDPFIDSFTLYDKACKILACFDDNKTRI